MTLQQRDAAAADEIQEVTQGMDVIHVRPDASNVVRCDDSPIVLHYSEYERRKMAEMEIDMAAIELDAVETDEETPCFFLQAV